MFERRMKRSVERGEALQFLVESVADRSRVRALVLIDDGGHIVAATGVADDIIDLARTARDVAWRRASAADLDVAMPDADVTARPVATREGMLYLPLWAIASRASARRSGPYSEFCTRRRRPDGSHYSSTR